MPGFGSEPGWLSPTNGRHLRPASALSLAWLKELGCCDVVLLHQTAMNAISLMPCNSFAHGGVQPMRIGMNRRLSRLADRVQAYVEAREASRVTAAAERDLVCFVAQFLLDSGTVSLPEGYDNMLPSERLQWWWETFAQSQGTTPYQTARICLPRSEERWTECRDRKYRSLTSRFSWVEDRGWEMVPLPDDRYVVCDGF
jgi:hypothetical protein